MRFAPSLRRRQAPQIEKKAGPPSAIAQSQLGRPFKVAANVEQVVSDSLLAVTWVFRAANAIAGNAARVPMVVRDGDRWKGQEVDHPLTELLNVRPNPYEQAVQFRFRASMQFLLSERGVFVENLPNQAGGTAELHLLPPDRTTPIPGKDGVQYFELTEPEGGRSRRIDPDEVVWLRLPHPTHPYKGMTALQSLGLSVDIDKYARIFQRSFLLNDGKLGGLVAVKGEMDDDVADEIEASLATGPANAGRWLPIEAEGVDLVDMSTSPRDAQYVEQRGLTKDEILLGLGVPESVAGNASGRTFDNADAELLTFWRETMRAHLDFVAAPFDKLLGDEGLRVGFDTSDIAVLQRDKRAFEAHMMAQFSGGAITLDELREALGRDPFEVSSTEALWLPVNKMPVHDDDDAEVQTMSVATVRGPVPQQPEVAVEGNVTPLRAEDA